MKTLHILLSGLIVLALASCGNKKQANSGSSDSLKSAAASEPAAPATEVVAIKKYPVKSAIVTFNNDMLGITQKTVLYIDDYGAKEAEEKYEGNELKEMDLCDGKMRYAIKFKDKTAFTMRECTRGIAYKFDWNEISKADKQYKVKKLANMSVAGKDCESYAMNYGDYPTTFAGWQNILLYQETKSKYGTVTKKAVKIEENASIPAEKFKVPEGYTVKSGM